MEFFYYFTHEILAMFSYFLCLFPPFSTQPVTCKGCEDIMEKERLKSHLVYGKRFQFNPQTLSNKIKDLKTTTIIRLKLLN